MSGNTGQNAWQVRDELATDLEGVESVVVRIVAGEVVVTAGERASIDVHRYGGDDVHVDLRDGVLHVAQPDTDPALIERIFKMITEGRRHRCTVSITAPPSCSVRVTTVSGDVVVSGFDGAADIKTVSGEVTMSTLSGGVDAKTVSGDVSAKGLRGGLKLKSVSGDVAVVDGACDWVDAKSVSGDVLLDLDLDPAGTYDISTVSGNVGVRTVADPDLTVDVSSVSGSLTSDVGLAWDDRRSGRRRLTQTIGRGGARLWVKTVSGDLRVLRGRAAA